MGLLDSFEKGLERAVNGAFAKTFRSGVQPVEIASALRGELDSSAAVVSRDRILAPNDLTVCLNPADADRMNRIGPALNSELDEIVSKHAAKQGYSFAGPVRIAIRPDGDIPAGTIRIESGTAEGAQVSWQAVVEIAGRQHVLTAARTVIGRGSDADITIADTGTSRKHVEILWDGTSAMVRDLGSTNGSKLDGASVKKAPLASGSVIRIGRTDIVFRVVPRASSPRRPAHDSATRIFDAQERPST
ncbi:MAG: FhaA domain-containing protein [Microbacterium sp.]